MNWKTILKSLKNRDMLRRVLTLLGIIIVYRFLAHVPVPLTAPSELKSVVASAISTTGFGGFLDLLSGGALTSFSIILVGLGPFITSSIIIQLLTQAIPKLEELHKDGESGRRKINQWTRIIAVPLAIIQSIAYIYILKQTVLAGNTTIVDNATFLNWVVAVIGMTTGSIMLMWLGELITEQGVGNGISLIVFAGIISKLPDTMATIIAGLADTSVNGGLNVFNWFTLPVDPATFWVTLCLIFVSILMLYVLVKINEAQHIVTINYAKRVHGNTSYGGIQSILPVKLLSANVIPIIFAVSFLSLPATIGQLLKANGSEKYADIANKLITWFQSPSAGSFTGSTWQAFIYPVIYFMLVIMFTYFYTSIVFNTNEISENLQKQGGFIDGVRPGIQTEKYLNKTINGLTLFGAIILGALAVMPFIADYILFKVAGVSNSSLSIGGTGLLIVVSVALESLRQVNSRALMVTYDDYK